ncbi:MAG: DUF1192 domain-containing protein [Rhodospirillales bacterium]
MADLSSSFIFHWQWHGSIWEDTAMDLLDLEPSTPQPKPKNLDEMSIEALGEYIAELEAEIARAKAAISAKETARDGAESVFKK